MTVTQSELGHSVSSSQSHPNKKYLNTRQRKNTDLRRSAGWTHTVGKEILERSGCV